MTTTRWCLPNTGSQRYGIAQGKENYASLTYALVAESASVLMKVKNIKNVQDYSQAANSTENNMILHD